MSAEDLLCDLIRFPSVSTSPNTEISRFLAARLASIGFEIEEVPYVDPDGVDKLNIVAKRAGTDPRANGGFAFFGHTDVVPAETWTTPGVPFEPLIENGRLYGRGSCDMKGAIAAVVSACETVREHAAPIWITLTGDEETGMWGALEVSKRSRFYRELVTAYAAGVIGEPTNGKVIHGHKGIAAWTATAHGKAAHSSTGTGLSASLKLIPFLTELRELANDLEANPVYRDTRFEPPTPCLNVTITDNAPASNITASEAIAEILVRVSADLDVERIDRVLRDAAERSDVTLGPLCFRGAIYRPGDSDYVRKVDELVGDGHPTTVPYGTDGSCFSDVTRLIVFGPGNIAQAHTPNEFITIDDLTNGARNYAKLIECFAGQ